MASLSDSNATNANDQSQIEIVGASTGVSIGNVGDRLKVTSPPGFSASVPAVSNKVVWQDMNASTGGVARNTAVGVTLTNMYSYSGSGLFFGFRQNCQTLTDWTFQLDIDGNNLFDTNGLLMSDMLGTSLYGFGDLDPRFAGLRRSGNILEFMATDFYPIEFNTSVTVKSSNTGGKQFKAGLVCILKET